MRKRINRTRTHNSLHIQKEIARQKMKLYRKCEQIIPICTDEAWKEISDPSVAPFLVDPSPSPEDLLISKDIFKMFSEEAKEVAKIILACPEEFFLLNGRISKTFLRNECKEKLGWSKNKTDGATFEIGLMLNHAVS